MRYLQAGVVSLVLTSGCLSPESTSMMNLLSDYGVRPSQQVLDPGAQDQANPSVDDSATITSDSGDTGVDETHEDPSNLDSGSDAVPAETKSVPTAETEPRQELEPSFDVWVNEESFLHWFEALSEGEQRAFIDFFHAQGNLKLDGSWDEGFAHGLVAFIATVCPSCNLEVRTNWGMRGN